MNVGPIREHYSSTLEWGRTTKFIAGRAGAGEGGGGAAAPVELRDNTPPCACCDYDVVIVAAATALVSLQY